MILGTTKERETSQTKSRHHGVGPVGAMVVVTIKEQRDAHTHEYEWVCMVDTRNQKCQPFT